MGLRALDPISAECGKEKNNSQSQGCEAAEERRRRKRAEKGA
jgi:hypothetical protein